MLTHDDLRYSPTREGVPSSEAYTAEDIVAAQEALEQSASEALPFSFTTCTYDLGYIRQPLYACLTCLNNCAVCAACSISCHGEHQLVELFNRRNFRCDCGSQRMGAGSSCSISARTDAPANEENRYDKNFRGEFCVCGVAYDPATETDSMYQCLVCEDWLHHACLLGSHIDLHASALGQDDFDQVICGACVASNRDGVRRIVERYAGRNGTGVMIVGGENGDQVLGRLSTSENGDADDDSEKDGGCREDVQAKIATNAPAAGVDKRKAEHESTEADDAQRSAKRVKANDAPRSRSASPQTVAASLSSAVSPQPTDCRAPPALAPDATPLAKQERLGRPVPIFLEEEGWQSRWCRCDKCTPLFYKLPYLLEEEETYEPPEDPDAHKSTMELGMDALSRMPRAQAIEGALAFQGLSERLKAFLRPYADRGETITKAHIEEYFEQEREARMGH